MSRELVFQLCLLTVGVLLLFWILLNPKEPVELPDERLFDVIEQTLTGDPEFEFEVDPDLAEARLRREAGEETIYTGRPAPRETRY